MAGRINIENLAELRYDDSRQSVPFKHGGFECFDGHDFNKDLSNANSASRILKFGFSVGMNPRLAENANDNIA